MVHCQCPWPQIGLEGVETLDKVDLNEGGDHLRVGRTCGLWSQVRTRQALFCLLQPGGPVSCAGILCPQWTEPRTETQAEGANVLGTEWQDKNRAAPHPAHPAEPFLPGPALPCQPGNPLLRRPRLTPGPAAVPGEWRRMQLPRGSHGPGETEPVLKRQGDCLPCLGRLPGMTGPEGTVPLGPGFSQSKAREQVLAITGTSVTPSPHTE